jgi:hypothetical protein
MQFRLQSVEFGFDDKLKPQAEACATGNKCFALLPLTLHGLHQLTWRARGADIFPER